MIQRGTNHAWANRSDRRARVAFVLIDAQPLGIIYNKDSALGIYLATVAQTVKSRVYNIGTGVGVTLRDFERVIKKHIPNAQMEIGGGLDS